MNSILSRFVSLSLLLICLFCAASQVRTLNSKTSAAPLKPADAATQAKLSEAYGKLPLSFEINRGQADPSIKFISRGSGHSFSLAPTEATLRLQSANQSANQAATVRMKMINANPSPKIEGVDPLPGKSNYLIGADPKQWRTDIPNYARVRYDEVWPGIDAVFYGNQRRLEYDFVVAPGADPRTIKLSYEGAKKISLDRSGDLILRLADGELRQRKPVVYQEVNGEKRMVNGRYVVKGNQVGFDIGRYDRSRELVIDPVLNYLAQLTPGDRIAVDGQGNAYIIAQARQGVFPSVNGESDILVMKLNPAGTQMVYNTILGGNSADRAADITVDAEGRVTLLANSSSPDFPGVTDIELREIFKSNDGAMNWQPSGRGVVSLFVTPSGFVFDPTLPGTLYVAGSGKAGLYKSVDGGGSWKPIGQTLESPTPLAVVPSSPSVLYVGTSKGLMSSADGGVTWNDTGLKQPGIVSLCFDTRNLMTLYAAAPGGLYKSTDSGLNWVPLQNGLPASSSPLQLVIDQANPSTLYVRLLVVSSGIPVIYRSVNGGANWSLAAGSPDNYMPERYITSLAVDPRDSTLYFGAYRGLFKSADGGQTVQALGLTDLHIGPIAIDPTNSATIYVSTPGICCEGTPTRLLGGIHKTTNGGATWERLDNSLKEQYVRAISIDPQTPTTLFAAAPSASFASGVYALRLSADGARPDFSAPVAVGQGAALVRDAADNLYVAGGGQPLRLRNELQTTQRQGFVAKLNGRTREIEYATYLAISPTDLAVDRSGMIAIVGDSSGNAADSLIKNGFQPSSRGRQESFVCRIDPQRAGADSLLFGSYLGGQGEDYADAVAVDANGMIYVTGRTSSSDFPTTPANQIASAGGHFLVKVDPTKSGDSSLLWATRLGGAIVSSLAVDAIGNAYITGTTIGGIPVTPGALQSGLAGGSCPILTCRCELVMGFCPARCGYNSTPASCSDAFLTKISADGSTVLYSTYFGSAADQTAERANDIALDQAGNVYLIGYGKLPATAGAVQLSGWDGFVAKLTLGARNTTVATVSAANYLGPQLATESLAVGFLDAFGAGVDNLQARVKDSAGTERDAQVFFSGFGQVNFQIPPGTTNGDAVVRVTSGGAVIANGALKVVTIAPGVFSADASGRGLAAAVAQRVKPDGTVTYEAIFRYDQAQNKFVAIPIDFGPEGDQMILALFGTGWRFRSSEAAVKVTVGGVNVPVTYAGLQPTLTGLDQINAQLPRTLAGKGEVEVVVAVDGKTANAVRVSFK